MAVTLPVRSAGGARQVRAVRGIPDAENVPQAQGASDPGVQVQPGAFQSGIGAGAADAAGSIADTAERFRAADERIRTRKDAVERARALGSYNEEANKEFLRLQTEDDISSPEALDSFRGFLTERQGELLNNHKGSEESKLRLHERLEAVRFGVSDRAAAESVKAQRKLVTDQLGNVTNQLSAKAQEDPGSIGELFASWDGIVDDMAPALTPDEERAYRDGGRSQIVSSAVGSLIDKGALEEAEAALATPGVTESLGAETGRKLRSRITVAKSTIEKERRAGEAKVNELRQILGREPTPVERTRLAGVAPKDRPQTISDKIVELETALGRPITQDEILRLGKIEATEAKGDFGTSLKGRAINIMTEDAPAFAAGLLSPDQERRFIASVTEYTQPAMQPNPDTGVMESRRNELPPFVREALERRGVPVPQVRQTQDGGAPASVTGGGPAAEGSAPPDQTIWGLAGKATGPVPAAGELLGRTPIIGEFMPAPQMTQARQFIPLVQRDLVRVLQNNPRYAEGERKAIESEISIRPEIYDTPSAFRNRLIAIDDALDVRERQAFDTARSAQVGRDERVQAMNVLNALVKFRQNLGVPPRFKDGKDVDKAVSEGKLRTGDEFIDKDGNWRKVP